MGVRNWGAVGQDMKDCGHVVWTGDCGGTGQEVPTRAQVCSKCSTIYSVIVLDAIHNEEISRECERCGDRAGEGQTEAINGRSISRAAGREGAERPAGGPSHRVTGWAHALASVRPSEAARRRKAGNRDTHDTRRGPRRDGAGKRPARQRRVPRRAAPSHPNLPILECSPQLLISMREHSEIHCPRGVTLEFCLALAVPLRSTTPLFSHSQRENYY